MAGGVDDVQAVLGRVGRLAVFRALPERGRGSGCDRDAALLLLLHPVHGGRTVVHLTDVVGLACVIQDPLRAGGLACIDMGHNAEVAVVL